MTGARLSLVKGTPRFLEANLSRLPQETERALRAEEPGVSVQDTESGLNVRTRDGRWVPVHASADPIAASERAAERFADRRPPLISSSASASGIFSTHSNGKGRRPGFWR